MRTIKSTIGDKGKYTTAGEEVLGVLRKHIDYIRAYGKQDFVQMEINEFPYSLQVSVTYKSSNSHT